MRYLIKREREYENEFTDQRGRKWPHLSVKEYNKLPVEERRICGDLKKKDSGSAGLILKDGNVRIGLFSYQKQKWWERTVGFIPVESDEEDQESCCVRIREKSLARVILIPLLFLAVLCGVFLAIYFYLQEKKVPGLDETAIAYHVEGLKNNDPTQIMMPGFSKMSLESGQTNVEYALANPEGNPCFFKIQIVLADTDEILYESGLIEPGKAVMELELNRGLDSGIYDARVDVNTFSVDDYETQMNKGAMNITIEVE